MAQDRITLDDVLTDLSVRFIINVPEEELQEVARIYFQIEQAHWHYLDFFREKYPHLPMLTLKKFSTRMLAHCPVLPHWQDHEQAYRDFLDYKFQVPVCGAILLNPTLDRCLLVKGWSARASWGFPRGKINQDEPEAACAVREVMEETGFDIGSLLHKDHYIESYVARQRVRLYIVPNVPESTCFTPMTRKEISSVEWAPIASLPTSPKGKAAAYNDSPSLDPMSNGSKKYYMVAPFVPELRQWVAQHRRYYQHRHPSTGHPGQASQLAAQKARARSPVVSSAPKSLPQAHRQPQYPTAASPQPTPMNSLMAMITKNKSPGNQAPPLSSPPLSPSADSVGSRITHSRTSTRSRKPKPDAESLKAMLGIGTTKPARAPAKAAAPASTAASRNAIAKDLLRQFQAASSPLVESAKRSTCLPSGTPQRSPSAQPLSFQSLMNRLTASSLAAPGVASTNAIPANGVSLNTTLTPGASLPPLQTSAPPTPDTKSKSLLDLFQRAKVPASQTRPTASQPPPLSQPNPMEQFEFDRALLENSFKQLKSS
ncbi:mRNA-decapping enzyme subunit 2 [Dimargaris verticillata]|uniref:mRNA-decapping enzyme subunit 2 n=1 Tax=Dimargaris verticillata TaxID=2761393 RepID=A0A9W8B9D2_9FUNG|nr:mRNA-decapping enzyme subunit 2 [Dimargaris verticillata]